MLPTSAPYLQLAAFRFVLRAAEAIQIPPNAGSTLRGGFGAALKRVACFQRSRPPDSCAGCPVAHQCPYGYLFETRLPPDSEVLRSSSEIPHPFVIEPPESPPPVYEPGSALELRFVLVGRGIAFLPYIVLAFERLGEVGMGRGRGRFQVEEVVAEHPLTGHWAPVYRGGKPLACATDLTLSYEELAAACAGANADDLLVEFVTPTRLVADGRLVERPSFQQLVRAALRRISSLSYFHCGNRWEADFQGMVATAERVETAATDLRWVDWERYSSRQETRMKLGGVVGSARYRGPVSVFLPLLLAAGVVHLGKACSFGNGKLRVRW